MEAQLENRTKIIATAYTFVIVFLLFLFFMLVVFSSSAPAVKVNEEYTFGSIEYGSLAFESNVINRSNANQEKNKFDTKKTESDIITSNTDESIVIKQNQFNQNHVTNNAVFSEKERVSDALQNALNKANQKNKGNNSIGLDGEPSAYAKPGSEKISDEQEYVKGRKLLKSPSRIMNATEEGVVVVSIIVDETGKVINAIPGQRGTTATNVALFEKARLAAYEAKFNPSPDGTKEQIGTYTFVFTLE